jgi:RNA polymerase sigma factor (sigma-70 family)
MSEKYINGQAAGAEYALLTKEDEAELGAQMERGLIILREVARQLGATDWDKIGLVQKSEDINFVSEFIDDVESSEVFLLACQAKRRMITANLGLVRGLARKMSGKDMDKYDDYFQMGCLGLEHAVDKFDYRKGFKFSTYATWWIRQSIFRERDNTELPIRLPVHANDLINSIRKFEEQYLAKYHVEPTTELIAEAYDTTVERVEYLRMISQTHASLDAPINADDDFIYADVIGDERAEGVFEGVDNTHLVEILMNRLTDVEREFVSLHFGLNGVQQMSHTEIAAHKDCTNVHVSKVLRRALSKLRPFAHS